MVAKKAGRVRKIPKRGKIDIKYTNPEVRQALRHRALLRHEGSPQLRIVSPYQEYIDEQRKRAARKVGKK